MQTPVAFPRSRTVTARAGTGWAGPTATLNTPVLLELSASDRSVGAPVGWNAMEHLSGGGIGRSHTRG